MMTADQEASVFCLICSFQDGASDLCLLILY